MPRSPFRAAPRNILFIFVATIVCLAGTLVGPTAIHFPFAFLLLAVLPGAAFSELFFGHRLRDPAEWMLTTVGASIGIVILGGLLLDLVWTLTRDSIAISAAGATVVLLAAAAISHRMVGSPQAVPRLAGARLSLGHALMLAAAAVLTVAAIAYARKPLDAKGAHGYTVLWMNPTSHDLELGVDSQELTPAEYRLDVSAGTRLVRQWKIDLAPGQTWGGSVASQSRARVVHAVLYVHRDSTWEPYRRVRAVRPPVKKHPAVVKKHAA